ncbi:hypothetical protein TeGR_g8530 [Tetraparma gracilis]|uniref:Uncharacterized protein n=1 Tax=Tetraparma gracilis TaxID=2962635 RepID=A0ABQ6MJP5_9STRA|nr:hypothetical protein TeGR_g8530 [Tetraparma gracilis]
MGIAILAYGCWRCTDGRQLLAKQRQKEHVRAMMASAGASHVFDPSAQLQHNEVGRYVPQTFNVGAGGGQMAVQVNVPPQQQPAMHQQFGAPMMQPQFGAPMLPQQFGAPGMQRQFGAPGMQQQMMMPPAPQVYQQPQQHIPMATAQVVPPPAAPSAPDELYKQKS